MFPPTAPWDCPPRETYVLEQRTIALPTEPIQSSFPFSSSSWKKADPALNLWRSVEQTFQNIHFDLSPAYSKYVVSGVLISKLCFLWDFKSADLTVVHLLKSIMPWGASCGVFAKKRREPLRMKYLLRQSLAMNKNIDGERSNFRVRVSKLFNKTPTNSTLPSKTWPIVQWSHPQPHWLLGKVTLKFGFICVIGNPCCGINVWRSW